MNFPLTATDYRLFETSELGDVALQAILDAAAAEIVRYDGSATSITEWFSGGQRFLSLSRPAASVTSVVETTTWDNVPLTLAATDYLAWPGGFQLQRVGTGTNPRWNWWGRVAVTYVPVADEALRIAVQVDLVKLALNYDPGRVSETIGAWQEVFRQAVDANSLERDEILSRLSVGPSLVVVPGG